MRKLTFNFISIEITRRCNMQCQHCLRGDAQEVDIDFATIDALAEQAARVYGLAFTGGEPTLNVPAMGHTLEELRRHGIPLHSVEVATNGLLQSKGFVEMIKGFSRYISEWNKTNNAVSIGISKDRYHIGAHSDEAFEFYKKELTGFATVKFMRRGDMPVRMGRGRALAEARPVPIIGSIPHQIEILETGKPCGCKNKHLWPVPQGAEKVVCCRLRLSAYGDLTLCMNCEEEYTAEDKHRNLVICNLSPSTAPKDRDIDCAIAGYNERFQSCHDAEAQEEAIQTNEYMAHPRRAIEDIRRAYRLAQLDPSTKAAVLSQEPYLEEQMEWILGLLDVADLLPEERLAELVNTGLNQPNRR